LKLKLKLSRPAKIIKVRGFYKKLDSKVLKDYISIIEVLK